MAAFLCALSAPGLALGAPSRSWTAPVELAGPAHSFGVPQVSMDAQGDTFAVWGVGYGVEAAVRLPGIRPLLSKGIFTVQAAIRPVGGSYGATQTLSNPSSNAFSPTVGVDANGEAIAIWTQDQPGETTIDEKSTIEYSVRPAGGSFGPAQLLSPEGTQGEQPRLAVNAAGEAVAVWLGAQDTELQYSTRSAGGAFGPAETIKPGGSATVDAAGASLDPRGDAIITWDEEEEPSTGVYLGKVVAAQRDGAAAFGSPVVLSEPAAHDFLPQAALDAQGDATVVWVQDTEVAGKGSYQVLARTLSSAGTKGSLQPLSPPGQNPEDPNVAADAAGEATAAWTRSTPSISVVEGDVLPTAGGSFDAPVVLDEQAGGFLESDLAVNEAGEAQVIWGHQVGSESEQLEEAARVPGGTFSAPVPVSSPGGSAVDPSLAIDPSGDAAAIWDAFGKETGSVQASNFAFPSALGGETGGGSTGGATSGTSSSSTGSATSGSSSGSNTPPVPPLQVSLKAAKTGFAKLLKSGTLKLTCTLNAPGTCKVALTLSAKLAGKLGLHTGRHAKTATLGTASVKFSAAGAKTVSLKLSSSTLRALGHGHGSLALSLTASARGTVGSSAMAKPIAFTLHL